MKREHDREEAMTTFAFEYRVRFSDTDWMGLLHHQHYPRLFEWAREELFRARGQAFLGHIEQDRWLAVLEIAYNIKGPAKYDRVLRVMPRLTKVTRARIWIGYEVTDAETGDLIATGHSLHTVLNSKGKVVRLPKDLMDYATAHLPDREQER